MQNSADKTWLALHRPVPLLGSASVVVLLVGLCGCGQSQGPTGNVTGKVTFAGDPVDQGEVVFFEAVGVPTALAELTPSGEFQLDEPIPVGEYQVAITPPPGNAPAGEEDPKFEEALKKIPPKYQSEVTSGFTAAVKQGDNSFTFEMH